MKTLISTLLILASATAYAGGMWSLVNSQFSGDTWYCTYQLQGTSIQSTITSKTGCQSFIYQN